MLLIFESIQFVAFLVEHRSLWELDTVSPFYSGQIDIIDSRKFSSTSAIDKSETHPLCEHIRCIIMSTSCLTHQSMNQTQL